MSSESRPRTEELFARGQKILVGGVNSPVRAFRSVGGTPLVIDHARGSRLWDVDGREYIDYVCSWGALILGHAHPDVAAAVREQAVRGTSFGMTSPLEIELGERISSAVPSVEMVRFVSSGTEATMSALRLARAFTGRDFLIKFEGCYHGHSDSFLSEAGSGLATLGISACPGVPEAFAQLTLNAPYNDIAAVEKLFAAHRGKIAAVIVEPVAANMGVVPPAHGFLESLRDITREEGALLIFDEVITGFRLAYGGAQQVYQIKPDLTTMGKIIGGGLPVAAYGGRREIMERVAPLGPVYQAGTLSGNPLAMRAGLAVLPHLEASGFYDALDQKAARLAEGLRNAIASAGCAIEINRVGSLLTPFIGRHEEVRNYGQAKESGGKIFQRFFHEMLKRGIFLPPSQFEALFVSSAHSDDDIDRTIAAAHDSVKGILAQILAQLPPQPPITKS
ncbi:MAG TPA: glutamate-1-semialdehyde 2,1-aminomutase [Candidatus Acidoferrales bacterium]|nr:glutamate-1-semialdehyde 2,1-aminomutase [Candidatus Acidoferrales bacterium]